MRRRLLESVTISPDGATPHYIDPLKGDTGPRGWTPMMRGARDGVRSLIEVYDWWGGAGEKPATGYLTSTGGLSMTKAGGFNFNIEKRLVEMQAVTNAQGVATFTFTPAFPAVPVILSLGTAPVTGGPVSTEEVAGSRSANGVQIRVRQAGLVNGLLSLLVGATVRITVIEA